MVGRAEAVANAVWGGACSLLGRVPSGGLRRLPRHHRRLPPPHRHSRLRLQQTLGPGPFLWTQWTELVDFTAAVSAGSPDPPVRPHVHHLWLPAHLHVQRYATTPLLLGLTAKEALCREEGDRVGDVPPLGLGLDLPRPHPRRDVPPHLHHWQPPGAPRGATEGPPGGHRKNQLR